MQAAAAATWKQYLRGVRATRATSGGARVGAVSGGARVDSRSTVAHVASSAAAAAARVPTTSKQPASGLAKFAANIATLLQLMNGIITSHPAATTPSSEWAAEWARVSGSTSFLSGDTVRKMLTHKKAKGSSPRASPSSSLTNGATVHRCRQHVRRRSALLAEEGARAVVRAQRFVRC